MYKAILFDLDGTLTESAPGITRSVAYALKKWGIEVGESQNACSMRLKSLADQSWILKN